MEDVELKEVLSSFKDAIDIILTRLDRYDEMYHAQDERMDELEKTFYEDILEPARKALDERIYEDEYSKWNWDADSATKEINKIVEYIKNIDKEIERIKEICE